VEADIETVEKTSPSGDVLDDKKTLSLTVSCCSNTSSCFLLLSTVVGTVAMEITVAGSSVSWVHVLFFGPIIVTYCTSPAEIGHNTKVICAGIA